MSQVSQKHFRLCLLNCENLFLYLDQWQGQELANLTEKEWQALSSASVPNKPLAKLKRLAQEFRRIDADLLMLNEIGGRESLENFNRQFLENRYLTYLIEGNSDRGIDVGYLIRRESQAKFVVISHRSRPLNFLYPHERGLKSEGRKSHFFSRDVLELRWFRPDTHSPAAIFLLVHLKSKLDPDGIDPGGKERRAAEVRTLVDIYNEIRRETPGTPMIVAGDFNGRATRKDPEAEFLPIHEQTDLTEAFDILERPLEESATQVNIQRQGQPMLLKIDHVFVSPELKNLVVPNETKVIRFHGDLDFELPYPTTLEQRQALPSDHYPVQVTLRQLLV